MFLIVSKYLMPKGFSGLTVFPFIFIRDKNMQDLDVLINHEKIHIRQQLEFLVVLFFIWYGVEFLIRWVQFKNRHLAYKNISFEREAYENEKDLGYLKQRSFLVFFKYL